MTYFIIAWIAFGLMNVGGYTQAQSTTKIEAAIFFSLGPIVSFVWIGSVIFRNMK